MAARFWILGGLVALAACGDHKTTPESVASGGTEGAHVEVTGEVHTVSWDSTITPKRQQLVARHTGEDPLQWVIDEDDEALRGQLHAYEDTGAAYPRKPDHYILIRSKKPPGVTNGEPDFTVGKLKEAWGLGIHLTDIDPANPMPEVGSVIHVSGTFHRITWNQRDEQLPILDDATIDIVSGPAPLAGPGESCTLDQACNARLVCDRATQKCVTPPREIYWADPWRDVNGMCASDADCPLSEHCDLTHAIADTGDYAAYYFKAQDVGKHLCVMDAGASVATVCPRIYAVRDLVGGRFATGKEVCVRVTMLQPVLAADNDTHDQVVVDEPIPYPEADAPYNLFGGVTENSPPYKDPALGAGTVADPAPNAELVAVGTFRYDPDHGWYEVHPVKAYFPAPP